MLEADRRLVNFHAEQFRHGIDLVTRRHGADDRALDAAIFAEVIQRQREHLVRREPGAVAIDDAEAVGVAVEAQRKIGLAAAHEPGRLGHAGFVRLGRAAAEKRVQVFVKTGDLRTGLLEQRVEVAAAGAVHQLDGDAQLGFADGPQVDQLANAVEVRWGGVEFPATERADDGSLWLPALGQKFLRVRLDFSGELRRGSGTVRHRKLETRVAKRIVAGGDVYAADGFFVTDAEGDDRRWRVAICQQRLEAGLLQNLRRGQGELASQKPRVVADDHQRALAVNGGAFAAQLRLEREG